MPAFDSLTTRMPNGVTNAAPWQTMGASGVPDPSWAHVYHNDFDTYLASDWTATLVGTGTQTLAATSDGGVLNLTTTAGATDAIYMQLTQATFQLAGLTTPKAAFFKLRGSISALTNQIYAGFISKSATPLTANDGVYIVKGSGVGTLSLVLKIGGVTTTLPFPTVTGDVITANSFFELGISIDTQGNVAGYFNPTTGPNPISAANAAAGQARGRVVAAYAPTLTQVVLSPSFGILNAAAAAQTFAVDYVTAVRER